MQKYRNNAEVPQYERLQEALSTWYPDTFATQDVTEKQPMV